MPAPYLLTRRAATARAVHQNDYEGDNNPNPAPPLSQWLRTPHVSKRYCSSSVADRHPSPVHLWREKALSYLTYSGSKVVLPMTALFVEDDMRAALTPLVTRYGFPVAASHQGGGSSGGSSGASGASGAGGADPQGDAAKVAAIAYAPWNAAGSDDKGTHTFTAEGLEAARAYEEGGEWRGEYSDEDITYVRGVLAPALAQLREVGLDFSLDRSASKNAGRAEHAESVRGRPEAANAGDYLG